MSITLYNTLARAKQVFEPADPGRVTMYVCGPTVYSHPHIGNARPAVVFDVLYRLLRHEYDNVVYARNITDVEDKINAAAKAQGVPISVITDKFTRVYHQDMQALGVLPPVIEPKATDHIPQMIAMISRLMADGYAYEAEGHVLFNVPAYKDYGHLSRRNREDLIAGARVEVAPYKQDQADFVLWKPSGEDTPGWDSPWGRGRPGWHLECSAMSAEHLGETIDIHAGGHDLIFPHHENEIAQSTCAHGGKLFSRFWLHNGFINVNEEKMAKSVGNVLLVDELLEQADGETIRMALLATHYRKPLDWSDETVRQAKRNLDRLYGALRDSEEVERIDAGLPESFLDALRDDLNTPQAFTELFDLARLLNRAQTGEERMRLKSQLLSAGALIGLLDQDPEQWFAGDASVDAGLVERLLAERSHAREAREFDVADSIRDQLTAMGIEIEDMAGETRWKVKSG